MISEICLTSEMLITARDRDSKPSLYTWRTRHAITTCLVTCVSDISTAPLAVRFIYKALGQSGSQDPDYMVMLGHIIIQVNAI
jgi:hypothetical protein